MNHTGSDALTDMPNDASKTGPMNTQPVEALERISTMVRTLRGPRFGDLISAAKAKILRRESLRKQRQALTDKIARGKP